MTIEDTQPPMEMEAMEVAQWMLHEVAATGSLPQAAAVAYIAAQFGPRFVHENENGNTAIVSKVLTRFRKIRPKTVRWDNDAKAWVLGE